MAILTTARQPEKHDLLTRFTNGVKPDQALHAQEIAVQRAWLTGLLELRVISPEEFSSLDQALLEALRLMQLGQFDWREEDEDIHMNLERFVNEQTSGLGKKMHLGRSRNDLIATTIKLHVAEQCRELDQLLTGLILALAQLAEKHSAILIPGMTHLQNGQAIRWSHALLAHAWALLRDREKLHFAHERALAVMPLGSAALAGTTLPLDLTQLAHRLGFRAPPQNSYDAVAERDVVVDFLQAVGHLGIHLSRLAEDIIYWSSSPVGLVSLPVAWSTGSSIMPNKRNPDVAELTRAKASRWLGEAYGVMTLIKGVPTSYASDLHETKEPYLHVAQEAQLTLAVLTPFVAGLIPNPRRAEELLLQGHILATELANHLTSKGTSFRAAYAQTAQLVERAEVLGCQVHQLSLAELSAINSHWDEAYLKELSFLSSVEARKFSGGTSLAQIEQQLTAIRSALG